MSVAIAHSKGYFDYDEKVSTYWKEFDLDIQVWVFSEDFLLSVDILSSLYESNEESIKVEEFIAFKNDLSTTPLDIQ